VAVARHVLDAEAPFGETDIANCALIHAAKDGDLSGINNALKAGADIDTRLPVWIRIGSATNDYVKEQVNSSDQDVEWLDMESTSQLGSGFTALMHASHEGHDEAVKHLLGLGASQHPRDADGMQALHLAAQSGSLECFRTLLEAGSDYLALDGFDRTAMDCASSDVVRYACLAILNEHLNEHLVVVSPRTRVEEAPLAGTADTEEAAACTGAASFVGSATAWVAVEGTEIDRDSTASKETTAEQNSETSASSCEVEASGLSHRKLSIGSASTEDSFLLY